MSQQRTTADYYSVLGIDRAASAEEIKAAFKARAKDLHPDKNRHRDTTADFQRLQEAYAVLADPEQRKFYDSGKLAAEIAPPARPPGVRVASVAKRRRRLVLVILAGAVGLFAVLFFLSQSVLTSASSEPTHYQPSGGLNIPGLDHAMRATIEQNAQSYSGAQPPPTAEVEIAGRDGRKYVVSSVVAKRLEPVRNQLFSASEQLRERGNLLKARREGVERERRTLDPTQPSAIMRFNEKVETLNRDNTDFERDIATHTGEIEAFFVELARVALRTR